MNTLLFRWRTRTLTPDNDRKIEFIRYRAQKDGKVTIRTTTIQYGNSQLSLDAHYECEIG